MVTLKIPAAALKRMNAKSSRHRDIWLLLDAPDMSKFPRATFLRAALNCSQVKAMKHMEHCVGRNTRIPLQGAVADTKTNLRVFRGMEHEVMGTNSKWLAFGYNSRPKQSVADMHGGSTTGGAVKPQDTPEDNGDENGKKRKRRPSLDKDQCYTEVICSPTIVCSALHEIFSFLSLRFKRLTVTVSLKTRALATMILGQHSALCEAREGSSLDLQTQGPFAPSLAWAADTGRPAAAASGLPTRAAAAATTTTQQEQKQTRLFGLH